MVQFLKQKPNKIIIFLQKGFGEASIRERGLSFWLSSLTNLLLLNHGSRMRLDIPGLWL